MPLPTFMQLLDACRPGGAVALSCVTSLQPATGEHGVVAPARYVSGSTATYAYETRYIDGEAQRCVTIDSKQSQLNRCEDGIAQAIAGGHELLNSTPRIQVTYGDTVLHDYDLPHRAFDGHIRAGTIDGKPATDHPTYRAARDATPANARALLELSPITMILGGWDSTRKSHQVRCRSALVGDVIGVLADQTGTPISPRGAARFDQFAPSVQLEAGAMQGLLDAQRGELSSKNIASIEKDIKGAKSKPISGSKLGLGAIPPSLDSLGFVACSRIIRSHVLSFSALRQWRFGSGPEGDAACRALLAALGLAGLVRANCELQFRANCDLVETEAPRWALDQRAGKTLDFTSDNLIEAVTEADAILKQAIDNAVTTAGIAWDGRIFHVTGNPEISANSEATADDDAE